MKNISIYDNGGKTLDRITIIFDNEKRHTKYGIVYNCIAASETGSEFFIHYEGMKGKHLGNKIDFSKLSLALQNKIFIDINN